MLQLPQADCPVRHLFGPGLYIREVTLPAGAFAIGHRQKTTHMNIMLQGRVMVISETGERTILEAPLTFVGQPGRKVGFILETVIWQNVYATDETDIEKLEAMYLDKSDVYLLNEAQRYESDKIANEINRIDFHTMLEETGFDADTVRQQSENTKDLVPMNLAGVSRQYRIADSPIEGKGYFLTVPAEAGDILAPARVHGKRTDAGRFVNHSMYPNATMINRGGDIWLQAIKPIHGAQGGSIGEEVTIDYRESLKLLKSEAGQCQA